RPRRRHRGDVPHHPVRRRPPPAPRRPADRDRALRRRRRRARCLPGLARRRDHRPGLGPEPTAWPQGDRLMPWPNVRDTELFAIIDREVERQNSTIQLIASENFASPDVIEATGSVLTNKYSEGYPGKRYYGGNEVIDDAEDLARDRAKALFGAEHANVQPHSGANANMAVYL